MMPPFEQALVSVQELTVVPHLATEPILRDLSFSFAKGDCVLLLGASGAGKSTLLLALSGVLQSLELAQVSGSVLAPDSGLLLQNSMDATVGQTVFRDVAFGAESAGIPRLQISHLVDAALKSVSLNVDLRRQPENLSGGELQRLCLAGLLTLAPELLLLDEPTSMLDSKSAFEVRMAVGEYLRQSGATAMIAEHKFEIWLPLVNRLMVLGPAGEIIDDGEPTQVLTNRKSELLSWGLWVPGEDAPLSPPSPSNSAQLRLPGSGEIEVLVGVSGAGKTSLLNSRLAAAVEEFGATAVGWVPQNPALSFVGNTVLDCAAVTATKLHGGVGRENALAWLERLGLGGKVRLNPHELSGGEQRRLAMASALAHGPKLLFLDEPTVGQDRINWLFVVSAIVEARSSGVKVVVATHDTHLIEFADKIEQLRPLSANASGQKGPELDARNVLDSGASRRDSLAPVPLAPVPQTSDPLAPSPLGLLAASGLLLFGSLYIQSLSQALIGMLALTAGFAFVFNRGYRVRGLGLLLPVLFGVVSLAFSNWWLSATPDAERAVMVGLRLAFFVIPGVLLARQIQVPILGDQLGQILRLPARPVIAGLVALGRVSSLQITWGQLALLRKLRGLDLPKRPAKLVRSNWVRYRDSVVSRFKRLGPMTLQLLLDAIRGATITAISMEARGFSATNEAATSNRFWGNYRKRSWAVPAKLTLGDALLVAAAAGIVALVILV